MEEVERESGSGDKDSTHPSSTAFLLNSLLKSFGENPYERPAPAITTAAPRPTSPSTSPSTNAVPLPPITSPSAPSKPSLPVLSPDEVLASLSFVPADEELPLFLSILPREVLILILQHLLLSGILPPPKPTHVEPEQQPFRGRRAQKKRTLKEEMVFLEGDLELDPIGEWKHDVEALERFALTCRAARVLTLDSALWRSVPFFSVMVDGADVYSSGRYATASTSHRIRSRATKRLPSSYDSTAAIGAVSSSSSERCSLIFDPLRANPLVPPALVFVTTASTSASSPTSVAEKPNRATHRPTSSPSTATSVSTTTVSSSPSSLPIRQTPSFDASTRH